MADRYIRSTTGNNTNNGTTWALAKATVAGADAIDTAGDRLFVSQVHAETTGAAVTWSFAGTVASPTKLLCGNDGAEPPTALATTATVAVTGAFDLTINGANLYCYGITFKVGSTSVLANIQLRCDNANRNIFDTCGFQLVTTSATSFINVSASGGNTEWRNCTVKFAAAGQGIGCNGGNAGLRWIGGGLAVGTTSPTSLFKLFGGVRGGYAIVEDLDLTAGSTSMNIASGGTDFQGPCSLTLRNCRLPSAWAGSLITAAFNSEQGSRVAMYNCASNTANYKIWIELYTGQIKDETIIVRTGGASDGTTPLSWKLVSNANAVYPLTPLVSDEIMQWNELTNASKTLTVEIIHDSVTALNNDEVWLEVDYLGSSAAPQGTRISNAKADILTAAAAQTTSTAAWTTTGITNINKQKLSVTLTPQLKGFFIARVYLAKASKTIYVDPLITVS